MMSKATIHKLWKSTLCSEFPFVVTGKKSNLSVIQWQVQILSCGANTALLCDDLCV